MSRYEYLRRLPSTILYVKDKAELVNVSEYVDTGGEFETRKLFPNVSLIYPPPETVSRKPFGYVVATDAVPEFPGLETVTVSPPVTVVSVNDGIAHALPPVSVANVSRMLLSS